MKRSLALDVFRGLTVALMILVNNPGSWDAVFSPLGHAKWHGLTFADLVFPFFLFAVGNAQSIVLPKILEGHTSQYYFKKVLIRTFFIFGIGFFLSWYPFLTWVQNDLQLKGWNWINSEGVQVGIRVMGVLQRIALAYGFSALITYLFPRKVLTVSLLILALYWGLCVSFGTGDVYSLEGWFGVRIDRLILGQTHLYQGDGVPFDPEGIMSTIPSVAQVMLGYWIGRILVAYNPRRTMKAFVKRGFILFSLGCLWHFIHPVNKKIWTGSYVLVTTGLAILVLAVLLKCLDQKQLNWRWTKFFEAFGKNPLFIFVLSGVVPKTLSLIRIQSQDGYLNPLQWFYENLFAHFPGHPGMGSLLFSMTLVIFYGAIAMWLDRKRIYFRV
jgi:predicted acyltransferase